MTTAFKKADSPYFFSKRKQTESQITVRTGTEKRNNCLVRTPLASMTPPKKK